MSWNEWRSHDLEAQFNPRTAVGVDVATASLDLWATQSKARKVELTGRFDLSYGAGKCWHHCGWRYNGSATG